MCNPSSSKHELELHSEFVQRKIFKFSKSLSIFVRCAFVNDSTFLVQRIPCSKLIRFFHRYLLHLDNYHLSPMKAFAWTICHGSTPFSSMIFSGVIFVISNSFTQKHNCNVLINKLK